MVTALLAGRAVHDGRPILDALDQAQTWGGPGMILGGVLYFSGSVMLALFAWEATRDVRIAGWQRLVSELQRHNDVAPWRYRVPKAQILAPEFIGAIFGFVGLGWILSGRALIGVPLMFGGPVVAWAIIPMLLSPYGDGRLPHLNPIALEVYLALSAVISVTLLWSMIGASSRR